MVDLALFFACHVFWPRGLAEGFDWVAALLAAATLVGLVHFKIGVMPVIGTCAVSGLGVWWLLN